VTLVLLPFFCSMLVTNDVALIVFVPFTLALLESLGCSGSMIPVIVLQTVAANLGSMATPVGNPQNLYLYAAYSLEAGEFFSVVLPLTLVSLAGLTVASLPVLPRALPEQKLEEARILSARRMGIYAALFVLCLLTVFRIVPYPVTTAVVVAALFLADKKLLKEIDFMLLLTFVCFFVVSENLGRVEAVREFLQSLLEKSTLLTAVGASQVISNVPAAVLLSAFTEQWRELLAGVNIGGLGTPIASLASLITMKLYLRWPGAKIGRFLLVFTAANVAGLVILLLFSML
jgi:Na+/H+ antiporter NhaD/arsenite permease-like protein